MNGQVPKPISVIQMKVYLEHVTKSSLIRFMRVNMCLRDMCVRAFVHGCVSVRGCVCIYIGPWNSLFLGDDRSGIHDKP
jgi:hypothetical protein